MSIETATAPTTTTTVTSTTTTNNEYQKKEGEQQQQAPHHTLHRSQTIANIQSPSQHHHHLGGEPNLKHPLENSWGFWFYKNEKSRKWEDNVKFITDVHFVEDFWSVYNHLLLVSRLTLGCDYMFFKKGIQPMWEVPENKDGGRWVLNIEKKNGRGPVDIYWLNTLLGLIGDQFMDESPFVNGVYINIRVRGDKLSLWTRSANDTDLQMRIGRRYREILGLKEGNLTFEKHDEDKQNDNQKTMQLKC